jgi:tetratricopeptide (TPR) repeat protein
MKSRLCFFLLALLTAATLSAQTSIRGDGRQAVEHAGIVLVKPQEWSKPNEAVVVRFTAYTNRGGYFVLRSPSGQERQVWVKQFVGAPILEPEIPKQILKPADRDALQAEIDKLKPLAAKVPSAAIEIERISKPLVEAVQRYDAGEVCIDGQWKPVAEFRTKEFYTVQRQLRESIEEYPDKTKFDLEGNANFMQLVELSKGSPALQAKVDAIRADLDNQILAQKEVEILDRLSNPDTSDSEAQELIEDLKEFKNPTEKTTQVLQQVESAALLAEEIEKLSEAMEAHFANPVPPEETPRLPANLAFQSELLAKQIAEFRKSSPPAAVRIPEDQANALIDISSALPSIALLFEKKNYVEAASVLTRLADQAAKIGPRTQTVLVAWRIPATQKVDLFSKLRAEGEAAEMAGNTKDAIAKYSEALEVNPNAELSAKIEQLNTPAKK